MRFITILLILIHKVLGDEDDCDMEFDMPFCSFKGPPMQDQSFLETLNIFLTFNDEVAVNLIDKKEYPIDDLKRGPTLNEDGLSAFFEGKLFLEIPQNEETPYFTYSMWLFFPRTSGIDKPTIVCPIFQKGNEEQNYPSVYFDQKNRQFTVQIDQTVDVKDPILRSASRIQFNQWVYVSVVSTSSKVKLYINGILDNIKVFQSSPKYNNGPLYVGTVPWLKDSCSLPFLLDKFQFYTEEIKAYFIQAQSQQLIEQASLHFGCVSCTREEAKGACISGYHLCTKMELYSGVYNVARQLGWVEYGEYIWTYNDLIRTDVNKGLAICCID